MSLGPIEDRNNADTYAMPYANGYGANSHAQVCPLCVSDSHISSACKQGATVSLKDFEDSAFAFRRSYWGSDARARKVGAALQEALKEGCHVHRCHRCSATVFNADYKK